MVKQIQLTALKLKHFLVSKTFKGLDLMQALVVLAIFGILLWVGIAKLQPVITKAKSQEAKEHLAHIQMLEQSYYFEHSKYSSDLKEIGYEPEKSILDGGHANYKYEIIEATPNKFKARATAAVDFNNNGTFNVWEIDQEKDLKEVTQD